MKKAIKVLTLIIAVVTLLSVSVTLASAVDVPETPAKVTAQTDLTSVTLSWDACEGATGYRVFQSVDGKWKTLKTTDETSYTVTGLTISTFYRFAVRPYVMVDDVVYWATSYTTVSATTLGAPERPASATVQSDFTSITLSWDACERATGYRVFQSVSGKWKTLKTTGGTSYTVTGLTDSTSYKFAIRPYVKVDGVVYWATSYTTVSAKTLGTPERPSSVKARTNNCTVVLSWDACVNTTGYRVYQSVNGSWKALKTTAATEYVITGLKADTSYKFAVKPYLNYEGTVYWAKSYTTVTAKTEKADVLKVRENSVGSSYVELTWNRSSSASGYAVFQRVDGKWKQLKKCSSNTVYYYIENLYYSTEYEFCVRSYISSQGKTYWNGTYSYIKVKTNGIAQMSSPSIIVLEPYAVKVTWSEGSFATGYRVFYREYGGKWIIVGDFTDKYQCEIKGLKPSTTYHFAVRPYEATSEGIKWHSLSRLNTLTTVDYTKVKILSAEPAEHSIALTWSRVPDAAGYRIYNRVGSSWVALKTVAGTEYTLTGLESDTEYNLAVRAYKKVNGSTVWYTVGPIKKIITPPGKDDLVAYRYKATLKSLVKDNYYIEIYDKLNQYGSYISDDKFGIGCKNGSYIIDDIEVENEAVDIIYTVGSGNVYLVMGEYKRYTTMDELKGYEWDYYTSFLSALGFYEHSNKITVTIEEFDDKTAVCEKFTEPEVGYTYYSYYVCDELIGMKIDYNSEGYVEEFTVNSITYTPSSSYFEVPYGYTYVSAS